MILAPEYSKFRNKVSASLKSLYSTFIYICNIKNSNTIKAMNTNQKKLNSQIHGEIIAFSKKDKLGDGFITFQLFV